MSKVIQKYCTELLELVLSDNLSVSIHEAYSFTTQGIRQAYSDFEGRGTSGKLLIKIGP
jgi:hypothetical protein